MQEELKKLHEEESSLRDAENDQVDAKVAEQRNIPENKYKRTLRRGTWKTERAVCSTGNSGGGEAGRQGE